MSGLLPSTGLSMCTYRLKGTAPVRNPLFLMVVRTGRAGKKRTRPNALQHIRTKRTRDRKLSHRQQARINRNLLKDLVWLWQEYLIELTRQGRKWIRYKRMFRLTSYSHRWDRFTPYLEELSETMAATLKTDSTPDPSFANAKLLLASSQPVNAYKAVTFDPRKVLAERIGLSQRMEVETDPVATHAALERWSNAEKKRLQGVLDELNARGAALTEKEAEVARLAETWQERLKAQEKEAATKQYQAKHFEAPTIKSEWLGEDGLLRPVSPSTDSEPDGEPVESNAQPEAQPESESAPASEPAPPSEPELQPKPAAQVCSTPTKTRARPARFASVEDESESESKSTPPAPKNPATTIPQDEAESAEDEDDEFDAYFLVLEQMFGKEFANAARDKARRAGA